MKKILILIVGLVASLPTFASAATFVMATTTDTYLAGETTILSVSVNPEGATMYTVMLDAQFSTNTLEVVSFTLNDKMLALKQDGYDALDNATGVLIKTGGYPGGINTVTPFGTIVLRAKQVGPAVFTITDKSLILDSKNADQQKGEKATEFVVASRGSLPVALVGNLVNETVVATASTNETTVTPVSQAMPTPSTMSASPSASVTAGSVTTADSFATAGVSTSDIAPVSPSGVTAPITQLAAVIVANAGENSLALGLLALLLVLVLSFYIAHTRNLFAGVVNKFKK